MNADHKIWIRIAGTLAVWILLIGAIALWAPQGEDELAAPAAEACVPLPGEPDYC